MNRGLLLSVVLALVALCSASSFLSGSGLARDAAAATDPFFNPQPASTLLAPGTTSLDLSVDSATATDCGWSLGAAKAYTDMTPFTGGAGTTSHSAHVSGLDASPAVLNHVYVRCASNPDFVLSLIYRSIAKVNPSFPRTANLWGYGLFKGKSAECLSRIDLWVFQSIWNGIGADLASQLRSLNPDVILLDSFNAVETGGLPEDYYLHDIHGKKIEVWTDDYRLDLTKPYVADYQAQLAYRLMLQNDLRYDGMFFDNVMTTQSWQTQDMWGNPVQIDTNGDGVADDPAALDAAWKAGVFREMSEFRALMPNAIVNGHAMNINEPGIAERFNGIGLGFATADVLEHERTFSSVWDEYNAWMTDAVQPHFTFFEASPPDQIAYGYGYAPWDATPTSTLEFARTLYPYMRFGLGLTLMNDGYFAYEFGDTWHGNNWWYDELNFNLGYPRGAAQEIQIGAPVEEKLVPGGDFERAEVASPPWSLWVDTANGYQATAQIDSSNPGAGNSSARVDVTASAGVDWHAALIAGGVAVAKGKSYDISFLARADKTRSISMAAQKSSPNWDVYGWGTSRLTTQWKRYTFNFESTGTDTNAEIEFMLGAETGSVWIDDVHFYPHRSSTFRREFDNGLVLLNPTWRTQSIAVGKGWRRLKGSQAPRFEFTADDSQGPRAGFKAPKTSVVTAFDTADHQAVAPFFHSSGGTLHLLRAGTKAEWQLNMPSADTYSIDAWWPAAPAAEGWSRAARYEVWVKVKVKIKVKGKKVVRIKSKRVATQKLDQSTGGDRWHRLAKLRLPAGAHTIVRLVCAGKRPCAADALYLRSKARYNDGSVAKKVVLAPMDAIVLRRSV